MARPATSTDVFSAIACAHRRAVLESLVDGEKSVSAIVRHLARPQSEVSKDLRVLSQVGLVRCRAEGRRRLYRIEVAHLRPVADWTAKFESLMHQRLDRIGRYLEELQEQGEST